MRFHEILSEKFNQALTVNRYGDKMIRRYKTERNKTLGQEPTGDELVNYLSTIDPSKKKFFTPFLCRWYADASMYYLEDAIKATDAMDLYAKFRNTITGVDLNSISFNEFLDLGDDLADQKSQSDQADEETQALFGNGDAKIYKEDNAVKIVELFSEDAAKYFGRGTRWCTSGNKGNLFNTYIGYGPLYVVFFKGSSDKWQVQFESAQVMDPMDVPVEGSKAHPVLEKYWPGLLGKMISKVPELVRFTTNGSIKQWELAVIEDPNLLSICPHHGANFVKQVLMKDPTIIMDLDTLTPEIIKLAFEAAAFHDAKSETAATNSYYIKQVFDYVERKDPKELDEVVTELWEDDPEKYWMFADYFE